MSGITRSGLAVVLGLLITQAAASYFVYQSNLDLLEKSINLEEAGYLVVPNRLVAVVLSDYKTALYGGLFFTFSLGGACSVLTVGLARFWATWGGRSRLLARGLLAVWVLAVGWAIYRQAGFLILTLVLTVPLPVFFVSSGGPATGTRAPARGLGPAFLIPLVVLGLVWGLLAGPGFFLDIRDYVLWSNPWGERLSDFYYRYTLFPAEAFKSLEQKIQRTCRVEGALNPVTAAELTNKLLERDYLPLKPEAPVDLLIRVRGDVLSLEHLGREVYTVTVRDFLTGSQAELTSFSLMTDQNRLLRRLTGYSLLGGFFPAAYLVSFTLIYLLLRLLLPVTSSGVVTGLLCLALGLWPAWPIYEAAQDKHSDPAKLLRAESWRTRVAGLREVAERNLDLSKLVDYHSFLTSPHPAIRYWTASALGHGRGLSTYSDLKTLLLDRHPNVVCQSLNALSVRGSRQAIPDMVEIIKDSPHWYVQWYAYRALRNLGWNQTASD
jgi:hypothetical protein